jgi:hypothetical protein
MPEVRMPKPRLSIIVVFYNMAREAPRTLYTLSAQYQRGVSESEYEVIAIDHGSMTPLDASMVERMGSNFTLVRTAPGPSPAAAINRCAFQSRGDLICICIDGARMLSPGIVRYMCDAPRISPEPVIATMAFHLGPKMQNHSMQEGYCQAVEDKLLESIDWRADGYSLFSVASLAGSSAGGWLRPLGESNCLSLSRSLFERLEGLDERFAAPGGGLVNLDYYRRAVDACERLVVLLGEGTFHQFHGGVATNVPKAAHPGASFAAEYYALKGCTYTLPRRQPVLLGSCAPQALPWLARSVALAESLGVE